jgi:general secretion pathway protein D
MNAVTTRTSSVSIVMILLLVSTLGSCVGQNIKRESDTPVDEVSVPPGPEQAAGSEGGRVKTATGAAGEKTGSITGDDYVEIRGSGSPINISAASSAPVIKAAEGKTLLNFERTDVQEVIKTVLGTLLGVNYAIDPAVKGQITLQSSSPLAREALIPTLETVLRLNGLVLTNSNGVYLVVPEASARAGNTTPKLLLSSSAGYQVLIVPLRYVAAAEMKKIIDTIKPEKVLLEADDKRNLLLIAGTQAELNNISDTIDIYDVNQLKGMSVGIYQLEFAAASEVQRELEELLQNDGEGMLADMVRLVAIERLNTLIAITPQERYLDEVRSWVKRLDYVEATAGRNMYVYAVEHARAEDLAKLLGELFTADNASSRSMDSASSGSGPRSPSPMRGASSTAIGAGAAAGSIQANRPDMSMGAIKIVADEKNNSLLMLATREDYQKLQSLIRQLDVMPMQVLVEASIVEVRLGDELSYGLQWFFSHEQGDMDSTFELFPNPVDPTFRYTLVDTGGDFKAVLDLLAADGRLGVLSSPSLMVQDNQMASIHVGQQVPIRTSETTSLATSGDSPLITSTIQYRDTGVLLEVKPRVNSGGMISLEITQQVDGVDETTTSSIDSPTIFQRKITTNIAVQSGDTIVLGGLITESDSASNAGIPLLRGLPGIGPLFSSQKNEIQRTELMVMITPTSISNSSEARSATQEMKKKMLNLFEE